ncbi:MAG: FkbM family methyltransferase [Pseudomonadota bacterium]
MGQESGPAPDARITLTLWFFLRSLFKIGRRARKRRALHAFEQKLIDPKVPRFALDCGANVGVISDRMLNAGFEVHAFEPDPVARSELITRLGTHSMITILPMAVSDRAGVAKLRRHREFKEDDLIRTESSSIVDRPDVSDENTIDVEVVDLCDYIEKLSRPVGLLKMDIEGAEVALIHRILDEGLFRKISYISVETHERFSLRMAWQTAQMRARAIQAGLANMNFDHP